MERDEDYLTVFYGKSAQEKIPVNSKYDFIEFVNSGISPSSGLKTIIDKYSLKTRSFNYIFITKSAYPSIELMNEGLSSRIIDVDYPNFTDGLADVEFDEFF